MAISVPNSVKVTGSGVTSVTTAAITSTTGSTLVASTTCDSGVTPNTPTDSKSNAFGTPKSNQAGSGGNRLAVWVKENAAGGSSHTFTFTFSGGTYPTAIVREAAGAAVASYDAGSFVETTRTNGNYTAGPSGTLAQANEAVFSFAASDAGGTLTYAGAPNIISETDGNSFWTQGSGYTLTSGTGAVTHPWTVAGSGVIVCIFGIKEAAGGGGSTISPTGIASAEALGAPGVSATVAPTGVASSEALGAPGVSAAVSPAAIASGEAVGTPAVGASVAPAGIASAEGVGQPAVAAAINAAGIASAEAFGQPVVQGSGVFPVGISSAEAFGLPSLGATIAAAGIPSAEAFGAPLVGDAPPPPVTTFPGFEVDQRRPRRLQERSVKPMLVRAMERRLQKVKPPKERAAARAKAIEFEAAALVLDGATQREIAPLLQQWEAQRPYIPPKLADVPTLDVFLSQIGFRIEQAQAQKAAYEAVQRALRQDEDALFALLLA